MCRVAALDTYMDLAARYVNAFDRKWIGAGAAPGDELLGTPDIQSLADLSATAERVNGMRIVPISHRLLVILAAAALLPALPLLLLEYPVSELSKKLLEMFFSL